MSYKRSLISDGNYLISDDDGNELVLSTGEKGVRILYSDYDSGLFEAAGSVAASLGYEEISFFFLVMDSKLMEIAGLLGYEIQDSYSIIGVNLKELFLSKAVKKSLGMKFEGISYYPLRDLMMYQLSELADFWEEENIPLKAADIGRFDEDLSGIAYDENMKIRSVILVCASGEDILIECLYGLGKNDPKYIMAAVQGFAEELIGIDLVDVYRQIVMIEANRTISPLLRRLLDKQYGLSDLGKVCAARKHISGDSKASVLEDGAMLSISRKEEIEEKLSKRKYQNNINWKMTWEHR